MEIHVLFAKISWFLLIAILLMRPLAQIGEWKFLQKNLWIRKQLGIVCGLAALMHVLVYLSESGIFAEYFFNPAFWSWKNLFGWGNLALIFLMVPFLTSNKVSQKYFKKDWQILQKFSYPAFVLTAIHVSLVKGQWLVGAVPVLVWLILWIWAEVKDGNSRGK